MSNAPVYYALAQAQFNPVAAMAKYVGDIQDRLRHEGYTLFEPLQSQHLQLGGGSQGAQGSEPQVAQMTSWLLTRADRTAGYILGPSSIAFHTTHYQTNNEFIPELLKGLAAVHAVVDLEHVSRLGLRYLDAVLPRDGESVDQYLASGLHGVGFDDAKRRYGFSESVFETESGPMVSTGTLVSRVYKGKTPIGYPADMVPSGLVPMDRFAVSESRPHAVIDTDHFVDGRIPLKFDEIGEQLVALHATIKKIFDATATDHARAAWA